MSGNLRRFLLDTSANFAIIASLLSIPVVAAAGIAIDYSTMNRLEAELQASLDSAALAIAREREDLTRAEQLRIARAQISSNYSGQFDNVDVIRDGSAIRVTARIKPDLAFSGVIGMDDYHITRDAVADTAAETYEIALVLDTTGSMKGGKMTAMKDAVMHLIDNVSAQISVKGRLQIGLVPYATFVNVGSDFGPKLDKSGLIRKRGANWLDQDGASPIRQSDFPKDLSRFAAYKHLDEEWSGCVETRPIKNGHDYGVDDTPPNPARPETLYVPAFAPDEPDDDTRYPNSYLNDNGAAVGTMTEEQRMLRYGINDYKDAKTLKELVKKMKSWKAPAGGKSKKISKFYGNYHVPVGPGFGCDAQPLTPLTDKFAQLKKEVAKLTAAGSTNIMEGVAWGWRILSPGEPFSQGNPKSANSRKIMIVLTDGSNSFGNLPNNLGSAYTSYGYLVDGRLGIAAGGSAATNDLLNARTLAACDNAKADGVELYTIRLEEPNAETGLMLKQCASSEEHFFDAPTRQDLDKVFDGIRESFMRVRITS